MALGESTPAGGGSLVPVQFMGRKVRKGPSGLGHSVKMPGPKSRGTMGAKSLASIAFGAPYGKGHPNKVPGVRVRGAAQPRGLRRR